jgi:hypothetical protein
MTRSKQFVGNRERYVTLELSGRGYESDLAGGLAIAVDEGRIWISDSDTSTSNSSPPHGLTNTLPAKDDIRRNKNLSCAVSFHSRTHLLWLHWPLVVRQICFPSVHVKRSLFDDDTRNTPTWSLNPIISC